MSILYVDMWSPFELEEEEPEVSHVVLGLDEEMVIPHNKLYGIGVEEEMETPHNIPSVGVKEEKGSQRM